MQRVVVIGTLHLGLTPKSELKKTLDELDPDQLLVELPADKSVRVDAAAHSDEMQFAANWAGTKGIPVNFFDINTGSILKGDNVEDDPDYQKLVAEEITEAKAYTWKQLNSKAPWEKGRLGEIGRNMFRDYIDLEKWNAREVSMLENIERLMLRDGTIIILTGAGHLDFFENNLPGADLLFRN